MHLVDLHFKARGGQCQCGHTHHFNSTSIDRQGQPTHTIQTLLGCVRLPILGIEHPHAKVHIAEREAHRVGVQQVQIVHHAIGVGVGAVSAAQTCKRAHVGRAHSQGIDLDGSAIGQLDVVAAFFKRGCAIQVHVVGQLDRHARRNAEHFVVRTVHAHQVRAVRAGQDREVRRREVNHPVGRCVGQVDAHAHIAHRDRHVLHTHQAGGSCTGLQRHTRGLRGRGHHGEGVYALAFGHSRDRLAVTADGNRSPVQTSRTDDLTPAHTRIAGHLQHAIGAACTGDQSLAIVGHRHSGPVGFWQNQGPGPIVLRGVSHVHRTA